MKKIILLTLLTIVGVLGASQTVLADSPTLSISPATLNVASGTLFNVSAQLNASGNKICVVMGTVNFNGLTCQNITVANGLMAQSSPTCSNPSFTIGIPKCTTVSQNIFSMSVKGSQADTGILTFTGLKIIGVGNNVASVWYGGAYNITAVAQPKQQPVTQVTQPAPQPEQQVTTPVQETAPAENIPTGVGAAALAQKVPMSWIDYIAIILVILIVVYGIYYFFAKRKKK